MAEALFLVELVGGVGSVGHGRTLKLREASRIQSVGRAEELILVACARVHVAPPVALPPTRHQRHFRELLGLLLAQALTYGG